MKHLLLLTSASCLALVLACQTEPEPLLESSMTPESLGTPESGITPAGASTLERPATAEVVPTPTNAIEEGFSPHAFPPMLPVDESHENPWLRDDCILCHETGVSGAPIVEHRGMPSLLLGARCRSCHVAPDPSAAPLTDIYGNELAVFKSDAFPPTLPNDDSHRGAWLRDDCLLCHEWGVKDAPVVRHQGMSRILLKGRCRTCHLPAVDSALVDVPE